ncbi:MAG: phosphopantetheine-binding protein [Bacteroidota bacterium]
MDDIKTKVTEILNKYIFDKKVWDNAPENPKIFSDLMINSARIVDVILDIEEEYKIDIDDNTLEKIFTINDIVDIIKEKTL